ncbi:MAG TPA: urate oxidase [Candidatus Baltobacteraceae bacterium]|nr:urate oxidase [Candidatus Baltobacteraceae bacterium]
MSIHLSQNDYGKSRVRLLRITRREDKREIRELTLAIRFEGDFETAHTEGDNSKILPTDTMKNTVYALARKNPVPSAEAFCGVLIEHFLGRNPQVTRVHVQAVEHLWDRIARDGKPDPFAFLRAGEEKRTALVTGTRGGTAVRGGVKNLIALKTTKSAFEGFIRDSYTTLREDSGRIMSTAIRADWLYGSAKLDFNRVWDSVRQTLLETFAAHDSLSLQHTLYAMGKAVLEEHDAIREIRLSLPNKHYNLADLSPFGMTNPGEVFVPTDEPHGLIEATLRRE